MANVDFRLVRESLARRAYEEEKRRIDEMALGQEEPKLVSLTEYEELEKKREEHYKTVQARVNEISNEIIRQCRDLSSEEFLSDERIKHRDELMKEMLDLIRGV